MNVQYKRFDGPSSPDQSYTGYTPYGIETIAAPPVLAFEFMINHDILASTHKAMVAQMLEFTRVDMIHLGGMPPLLDSFDTLEHQAVWGYRGVPPVASMTKKKVMIDPTTNKPLYYGVPWAVSRGCWGASEFFQAILRAANIPVDVVPDEPAYGGGGHGTAEFHTIDMALPDGDDAYNGLRFADAIPMGPAGDIIITQQTRQLWFLDPSLPFNHHGMHQPDNMALKYLSTQFLINYCADKKANLPHATGTIYPYFAPNDGAPPYYTLQELETTYDLWNKLDAKAKQLNLCK